MTPGAVVDWLEDLIATPSLVEQIAFINARPELFAEKPEPVAPLPPWSVAELRPAKPSPPGAVAYDFVADRYAMRGALGGIFGGSQAMQNEMAAFQAARQQQAASSLDRAAFEQALRDYDKSIGGSKW